MTSKKMVVRCTYDGAEFIRNGFVADDPCTKTLVKLEITLPEEGPRRQLLADAWSDSWKAQALAGSVPFVGFGLNVDKLNFRFVCLSAPTEEAFWASLEKLGEEREECRKKVAVLEQEAAQRREKFREHVGEVEKALDAFLASPSVAPDSEIMVVRNTFLGSELRYLCLSIGGNVAINASDSEWTWFAETPEAKPLRKKVAAAWEHVVAEVARRKQVAEQRDAERVAARKAELEEDKRQLRMLLADAGLDVERFDAGAMPTDEILTVVENAVVAAVRREVGNDVHIGGGHKAVLRDVAPRGTFALYQRLAKMPNASVALGEVVVMYDGDEEPVWAPAVRYQTRLCGKTIELWIRERVRGIDRG